MQNHLIERTKLLFTFILRTILLTYRTDSQQPKKCNHISNRCITDIPKSHLYITDIFFKIVQKMECEQTRRPDQPPITRQFITDIPKTQPVYNGHILFKWSSYLIMEKLPPKMECRQPQRPAHPP